MNGSQYASWTMPFGRHKGTRLRDIPTNYLTWLLTIDLAPDLERAVMAEVAWRKYERTQDDYIPRQRQTYVPAGVSVDAALELITEGRRALARRYHPDRTGDTSEALACANATADFLEDALPTLLGAGL